MMSRMSSGQHSVDQPDELPTEGSRKFGAFLRDLRESYLQRVGQTRQGTALVNAKLSQAGLLKCLESHDVPISQSFYSQIESGAKLPADPKQFLGAVKLCLELKEEEVDKLVNLLGFAFTEARFGTSIALRAFPPLGLDRADE